MVNDNKQILEEANAAVTRGDYEKFLSFCTDDTIWTFIGERTLYGKQAVREYMQQVYLAPPEFMVEQLIAEDDFVTAIGKISLRNQDGGWSEYAYCDVWRLRENKLHELKAFVIEVMN
jgi:ketosteroid isomerase-like protein